MEPLIRNISDTARWVAVSGIKDTERPDAIFNDPFARKLAGERGQRIANAIEFTIKNACSFEARMYLLDNIVERDVRQSYLPDTTYTDDSTS